MYQSRWSDDAMPKCCTCDEAIIFSWLCWRKGAILVVSDQQVRGLVGETALLRREITDNLKW